MAWDENTHGAALNSSIINKYSIRPKSLAQYTAYRGITDFTQIGQFNQYESGYQFLSVIGVPKFLQRLAKHSDTIKEMLNAFIRMLEFEFRGLEGLPDMQAETLEITDGINTQRMISRVTRETSATVTMNYFERSGGLIEKLSEIYLTGIKDPMTQAKTYHGLIAANELKPGYENEVFTMMYYVTDNTMLRLERAFLLCNMQLTRAESSMYNGSRDNINNKEMSIEFNCFPVIGYHVDRAASALLKDITGVGVSYGKDGFKANQYTYSDTHNGTQLDSSNYAYGIMRDESTIPIASPTLKSKYDSTDDRFLHVGSTNPTLTI